MNSNNVFKSIMTLIFAGCALLLCSQETISNLDSSTENRIEFTAYLESPLLYDDGTTLILMNIELAFHKHNRLLNTAVNCGFGMGFSKYGVGPFAVPIEIKLLIGRSDIKTILGLGVMPIGADVMIRSKLGIRKYLFSTILLELTYTPYFFIPYGDREENEPYIDIESDLSIGLGFRL